MRGFLLFFLFLPIINCGQNTVTFISGEKIFGKVDSIINNELYFEYKGNKMTFQLDRVNSVVFNDATNNISLPGGISGTVTYYFNSNFGYKPDIGAEVFLQKINGENVLLKLYQKFRKANSVNFDELDDNLTRNLLDVELSRETISTVVDGTGNYSLSVPTGIYNIIIISKGRNGMSMSEISGKIYMKQIEVKSSEDIQINCEFNL